ncbi:MAG: hypothetical protein ACRD03_10405 [Acidimicrobiales bacterium]
MPDRTGGAAAAPLLHIGYHKTATSWLQERLFQDAAGCFVSPWSRAEIVERFIRVNAFQFDPTPARAWFSEGIAAALGRGLVPVLSHEQLAGNAHSGGHNSKANADRLGAVLPGARVLIVIREQRSMVVSVYKQYVRACGVASIERYMHPPRRGNDRGIPLFDAAFLEYHHLIGYYRGLFGDQNVLVLPFEAFQRDAARFVDDVVAFAGATSPRALCFGAVNSTISAASLALKRRVNMVLVRDALNPLAPVDSLRVAASVKEGFDRADRFVPASLRRRSDERLRRYVGDELAGRYRDSNRVTAALTGVDLGAYGYQV